MGTVVTTAPNPIRISLKKTETKNKETEISSVIVADPKVTNNVARKTVIATDREEDPMASNRNQGRKIAPKVKISERMTNQSQVKSYNFV